MRALAFTTLLALPLSGCYLFDFFHHKKGGSGGDEGAFSGTVLGQPLGAQAGGLNEAALAAVYAASASHAPAVIRPDPDTFVRQLIRQYRPESATVARQIGTVEQFRPLLGGASQDFATPPQKTYDATSLLAVSQVAQEVCRGLVAPDSWEHGDWQTILPNPPDQELANITWLAQRITGKPSTSLDAAALAQLQTIMQSEEPYLAEIAPDTGWSDGNPYAKYVPVCATLALDSESLYF
jgi:hypothetical protein